MKADVYTGFLTGKVKVFGTTEKAHPFVISGRTLRKAAPFLLASAMMLTACSRKQPSEDKKIAPVEKIADNPYADIYQEVINTYHLNSLKDKEPLPQNDITALLSNPAAPVLLDTNFNHCPVNQDNFWEIIRNGVLITQNVQKSEKLTAVQKKEYRITAYKMLAQISRIKGTADEVDLSDYNNLKSFLYFEKVIKYKDDYDIVLGRSDGWIDERAEIFGRYYKDYKQLEQKAEKYSGIRKFATALYDTEKRFVIPPADSARANAESRIILKQWMEKQNIKDKRLWYLTTIEQDDFVNAVAFWYKRGETVGLSLGVDRSGQLSEDQYSPVGTILIHEMMHLMQKKPASAETPEDNLLKDDDKEILNKSGSFDSNIVSELAPTLYSLMLEDKIYRKITGLGDDGLAFYGTVDTGAQKIELSEVAKWFGRMTEKYPYLSADKILAEPEVLQQLDRWGNGTDGNILQLKRPAYEF